MLPQNLEIDLLEKTMCPSQAVEWPSQFEGPSAIPSLEPFRKIGTRCALYRGILSRDVVSLILLRACLGCMSTIGQRPSQSEFHHNAENLVN